MLLISDPYILSSRLLEFKREGRKISFIPTMGNLHKGHLKLIREGKKENFITLLSIFVNPLQFNDINDYKNYPRTLEQDKKLAFKEGVDILFNPNNHFILKKKKSFKLGDISKKLCGSFRKGHFEGVSAVVIEFLNLINPDLILLGEKDFQQTIVIKKIIKNLDFKVKVKVIPTVRDQNDVALSSRNKLLGADSSLAVLVPKTLNQMIKEIKNGNFKFSRIDELKSNLIGKGIQKVDYLEILKEKDLNFPDSQFDFCRVFISAKINGVRLIDNMRLNKKIKLSNEKFFVERN